MTQQQRFPVLIAGSSHVRRLGQHVSTLPNENFNITTAPLDAIFFGIGGGKLENEQHVAAIEYAIQRRDPSFLILHIGGNDLDTTDLDDIFCQRLVLKLALMTKTFLIRHNIQFVFVCELFPRETPRNVSAGTYNKYKRLFNKLLKGEIKKMNYVCFWKIRGIQETKEDVFTDSVHLGMEGTTRYYRSIRGALLQETFRSIIFLFIFYFPLTMMINLI